MRVFKTFLLALIALPNTSFGAESSGWTFVWVASGADKYEITEGTAVVTIEGAIFHADLHGANGVEYSVSGTIDKTNVKATFSVLGSDYFVDSPFSGTFQTKRWAGVAGSKGRESFALSDGWNFIGLTREIGGP
jgi:hypothetical protein